jgi:hypothetical protein
MMWFLNNSWARLRESITDLFPKKPPEPGKFVADRKVLWRGFLAGAPFIPPQREYLAYVPAGPTNPWEFSPPPAARTHPRLQAVARGDRGGDAHCAPRR